MWNPWKHLRLAGALTMVIGCVANQVVIVILGWGIQYLGVVAALDLTERRLEALEAKESKGESQ